MVLVYHQQQSERCARDFLARSKAKREELGWPGRHTGVQRGREGGSCPPLHPTQYFLPLRPCRVATHSLVLAVSCSFSQAELKGLELLSHTLLSGSCRLGGLVPAFAQSR